MIYAQFWHMSTGYVSGSIPPRFEESAKRPVPACGDRSVIILDGRNSREHQIAIARQECAKRGYVGFTLEDDRRSVSNSEIRALEMVV